MSGILGQSAPSGGVLTDAYTVPASTVAAARVIIANRGASGTTFRIAVSPNGAAISNEHYLAYDQAIDGNDTGASVGFVAASGDIVRVYGANANLSFTVTGETRAE